MGGRWSTVTGNFKTILAEVGMVLGETLGPLLKGLGTILGAMTKAMESKTLRVFMKFTTVLIGAGGTVWAVAKVITILKGMIGTIQAVATANTIMQGTMGPAGWLAIASGAAVAAAGVAALAFEFRKLKDDADDAMKAAGKPITVSGGGLPGVGGAGGGVAPGASPEQAKLEKLAMEALQELATTTPKGLKRTFGFSLEEMLSPEQLKQYQQLDKGGVWQTIIKKLAKQETLGQQYQIPQMPSQQFTFREAREYMEARPEIFGSEDIARMETEFVQRAANYGYELNRTAGKIKGQGEATDSVTNALAQLSPMFRRLGPIVQGMQEQFAQGMQEQFAEGRKKLAERQKELGKKLTTALPMALGTLLAGPAFAASLGVPAAMRAAGKGAGAFAGTYGPKEPPRRAFSISSLAGLTDTMQAQAGQQVQQRQLETQQGMLAKLGEMIGHFKRIAQQTRTGPAFWGETAIGR
jgi:hypothetical protein